MLFQLFLILPFIDHLSATCNICQDNRIACHSKNSFSICIDDTPTYSEITCPDGLYCTNGSYICHELKPLCQSDKMDISALPDVLEQDTTEAAAWNADDACLIANRTTTFQNQVDQTCNSYIYCYLSNGIYRAQIRKCKLNEYFDETLKSCSTAQPEGCISE